jgi:uncharacterized protein
MAPVPPNPQISPDLADRSLWPFLGLAFGVAWGSLAFLDTYAQALEPWFGPPSAHHPLFMLAVYAPALSAVALVLLRAGLPGLGRFLSRLLLVRFPASWLGFLLIGIPAVYYSAAWYKGNWPVDIFPFAGAQEAAASVGFMLILGPMEEFGWRGVVLPILQRKFVPLVAGLVLGVIWALWHLPAFYLSGTPQSSWDFAPFFIGSVAVSVILVPLFNAARGSILVAMLFHFQLNNPFWPDGQPWDMYLFAFVAVVVVLLNVGAMTTRSDAATVVIPD